MATPPDAPSKPTGTVSDMTTLTMPAESVAARTGVDIDTLAAGHAGSRSFCAAGFRSEDATIVGLAYTTDYRSEEEHGVGDLRTAITSADPRRFQMTADAAAHIAVFDDVNAIALSSRPLRTSTPTWGDELRSGQDYDAWWARSLGWVRGVPTEWDLRRSTMTELRAVAATLGLGRLPRTKVDAAQTILAAPNLTDAAQRPNCWPGWFHMGDLLVLRADEGPTAEILAALIAAARRGTLGIGNGGGAFSTGLFLYDTADETDELQRARQERFDWQDARMADIADVSAGLRADGWSVYFLGRPTLHTGPDGVDVVRYWLNGCPSRYGKQVVGWFSAAQLAARDFPTR